MKKTKAAKKITLKHYTAVYDATYAAYAAGAEGTFSSSEIHQVLVAMVSAILNRVGMKQLLTAMAEAVSEEDL